MKKYLQIKTKKLSGIIYSVICMFLIMAMVSCTSNSGITKRKYNSGYYISFSKHHKNSKPLCNKEVQKSISENTKPSIDYCENGKDTIVPDMHIITCCSAKELNYKMPLKEHFKIQKTGIERFAIQNYTVSTSDTVNPSNVPRDTLYNREPKPIDVGKTIGIVLGVIVLILFIAVIVALGG